VQTFIAAARSSHDLTYGSWLLSELTKTVARTIVNQEEFDSLVFPAPAREDDLEPKSGLSVANKVVAVVESDPKTLADVLHKALIDHLLEEWKPIEAHLGADVDGNLARRQLKDLPEFYWAAAPLPSPNEYTTVRDLCEEALNARKATRDFTPHLGASRFKSSNDGAREHVLALVPDHAASPNEQQMRRYRLRNGELLSGVDLLKRLGELPQQERYKSISHMAALPLMQGLGEEKAEALHEELVQLFKKHGAASFVDDYSVLYPSEVRAAFSAKDKEERERIKQILKEQQRILNRYADSTRPNPYYALLLADGDYMGKVIDAQKSLKAHRNLSQHLSKFAREVPRIVRQHKGVPIYSGGDDMLAYLPLHMALDCVQELADTFGRAMADFTFTDDDGKQKSPTLSAGLVIAHHLEPLSEVLELARRTEKAAKAVPGKNALAITLSKRSGAERQIRGSLHALVERLQTVRNWWLNKSLSKGTPYEFEQLAQAVEGVLPADALQAEAVRILKRKRESGGESEVPCEVVTKLQGWIEDKTVGLYELTQEMIVAAELASAAQQARGKEA
jgi:CRISPR-associated protein Cmr2